jgi:hypothetical protein
VKLSPLLRHVIAAGGVDRIMHPGHPMQYIPEGVGAVGVVRERPLPHTALLIL